MDEIRVQCDRDGKPSAALVIVAEYVNPLWVCESCYKDLKVLQGVTVLRPPSKELKEEIKTAKLGAKVNKKNTKRSDADAYYYEYARRMRGQGE